MKRSILVLSLFLITALFALVSCASNSSSTEISPVDTNESNALENSGQWLKTVIQQSLSGYDVSVNVSKLEDDSDRFEVVVYVYGGVSIDEYIYGMVADKTMEAVNSEFNELRDDIDRVEIVGSGDERVLKWVTTNLSTGPFWDVPRDPSKIAKKPDASLSDILSYCKYVPQRSGN